MKLTQLKSVGCFIDENGITYPELSTGTPDLNLPVHINDVDIEWLSSLSLEDTEIVHNILNQLTISSHV